MAAVSRKYWPYDEVTISRDAATPTRFLISAPWLKFYINVNETQADQVAVLAGKISAGDLSAGDIDSLAWLFSSFPKYALSYVLPSASLAGKDKHSLISDLKNLSSPKLLLKELAQGSPFEKQMSEFAERLLPTSGTWEYDAALDFSRTPKGIDPSSVFSVARRFHLLNDLEQNKTGELLDYMKSIKNSPEDFKKFSRLLVRQNHYITVKCDQTLRAALPISQNAEDEVLEFLQAEAGHDHILEKALKSLGTSSDQVPVLDVTTTLMELFKIIAAGNFLAFAMVVDIFERTTYRDEDPFATALKEGGESVAAKQMDVHRIINDEGEHENVALGFLSEMAAVDENYAREALALCELLTLTIHQLSAETLRSEKS